MMKVLHCILQLQIHKYILSEGDQLIKVMLAVWYIMLTLRSHIILYLIYYRATHIIQQLHCISLCINKSSSATSIQFTNWQNDRGLDLACEIFFFLKTVVVLAASGIKVSHSANCFINFLPVSQALYLALSFLNYLQSLSICFGATESF